MNTPTPAPEGTFDALRAQLDDAAARFADGPDALEGLLLGIVDDVERATAEPVEIFPVCHHSPASALAMARRLREKAPQVIYLELCEDLAPILPELRKCTLPVAAQAFASDVEGFPTEAAPLSVLAPFTEASAEAQAISYALSTPGVELVLVDRSADHVFQWQHHDTAADAPAGAGTEGKALLHGDAVGVQIGDLRPRLADLEQHLLRNGRVRHWSEWWHQYVELPLAGADHDTYRNAMFLIGSLFRRLAPGDAHRAAVDLDRDRYMWTRIREHLSATGTDPANVLYVCGAAHAASPVAEFGLHGADTYAITPRTATTWQYGLVPSSHAAIEQQFGLAAGSVSIAASGWAKNLKRYGVTAFRLGKAAKKPARARKATAAATAAGGPAAALSGFLQMPPVLEPLDVTELVEWSTTIVRLARTAGYLASPADSIAIVETAVLLAGMRDRARPTPYDFADAAVTCLEKDRVPGRRDIRRLVESMLGGDRIGTVGYEAMPPLARDVHDRLAPLGINLQQRRIARAHLDLTARPDLNDCSDVLWRLKYLLPHGAVRPIVGDRQLGERSLMESWDVALGAHQRDLIMLGYQGVTIEQVLEQRLREAAHAPQAAASHVLDAVEDALVLLGSGRLADELGAHALHVLSAERTADSAPDVLRQIRRLLAHYRTSEPELPAWIQEFVTAGYRHYCTLLPGAFTEEEATARQVAAMVGFLFAMESVAVSLGCDRIQMELALSQAHPESPDKVALLWAAQVHLGRITRTDLRQRCGNLLDNPLALAGYPRYISGFVHALEPVPALADFVVEAISTAFARLPDPVLLPWLPLLITGLRANGSDLAPLLIREAARIFPGRLDALDAFIPPWLAPPAAAGRNRNGAAHPSGLPLLAAHPGTCDAAALLLGCLAAWPQPTPTEGSPLLAQHSETASAAAVLLGI